jgi:DNA-binding NarL/FixJ family response regulator
MIDSNAFSNRRSSLDAFILRTASSGKPQEMPRSRPWLSIGTPHAAAVRIVASGEALLAPAVTRTVIEEFAWLRRVPTPELALVELTPREREVLELLARRLSNPEICERLVVSEATTKTHVARILHKLGLRDRVQAAIYAYESGLVAPGSPSTPDKPAG